MQRREADGDEHELRAGHRGRREREPPAIADADRQRKQRPEQRARQVELQQRVARVPGRARRNAVDARAGGHSRDAQSNGERTDRAHTTPDVGHPFRGAHRRTTARRHRTRHDGKRAEQQHFAAQPRTAATS